MQQPNIPTITEEQQNTVSQGSILGLLLYMIYINDPPASINTLLVPMLFTTDTSVIIYFKNCDDFCILSNTALM
jgi:hypothetical protein